jgi:hypothetical protein
MPAVAAVGIMALLQLTHPEALAAVVRVQVV